MPPARLEARMDSLFSFPVGLFHPLQHAGFDPGAPKLDVAGSIPVPRSFKSTIQPAMAEGVISRAALKTCTTTAASENRYLQRSSRPREELFGFSKWQGQLQILKALRTSNLNIFPKRSNTGRWIAIFGCKDESPAVFTWLDISAETRCDSSESDGSVFDF
jgi:hypothetical protein